MCKCVLFFDQIYVNYANGEVRKIPLFHCMDWLQGVFYLIFWIWTGGISAKCGIVCGGER